MKKNIFIIAIVVAAFTVTGQTYAAGTPTPTSSTESKKIDQQINQLKDKIASRVSQLNLVEKRGVIGTIKEITDSQITLTTVNGTTQYVDIDEITKFTSNSAGASATLASLQKGMKVSVLGNYNKESQRILARFVSVYTLPVRYSGIVTAVDAKNFQITVTTSDKKSVKVDIATTTKISSYTSDAGIVKSGFSKLTVGTTIYVVGYPDKKDTTLLIADRVIAYPNAPKDTTITVVTPTNSPTTAPTSAGAKNIKPIQ